MAKTLAQLELELDRVKRKLQCQPCSTPGSGSGGGISVGLVLPSEVFNITNSPVTNVGDLSAAFQLQAPGTAFMGPASGVPGIPSFRQLLLSDLPSIPQQPLFYEDSSTIDHTGDGTALSPLISYGRISEMDGNSIIANDDGFYSYNPIENGVVSGGIVTWLQDYDYHVSPAVYYINRVRYTSPEAFFTLTAPDLTDNRLDTFILDVTSTSLVLEGIPSSNPAQAAIDPETQLQISLALVEVGTTEPTLATECLYRNNAEWTSSTTNAIRFNPDSTVTPCNGAKSIEATGLITNDSITLTRLTPFTPTATHSQLTFLIHSKGNFANVQNFFRIQWQNAGIPVGNPANVRHGSFGFVSTNTGTCQIISIPLTYFGLNPLSSVDSLKITGSVFTGTIGFWLDDICLQGQPVPEPTSFLDEKVKISSNDTTPGYLLDKLYSIDSSVLVTEQNNGSNERISLAVNLSGLNGLSKLGTNIELGGNPLYKNTTIDTTSGFALTISGDVPSTTENGTLIVINNVIGDASSAALYASASAAIGGRFEGANYGVYSRASISGGVGVRGESGTGTSASGIVGYSTEGISFQGLHYHPSDNSSVLKVMELNRGYIAGGGGLDGIGQKIVFNVQTSSTNQSTHEIHSKWTTSNLATRVSQYEIWGVNNAVLEQQFTLKGTGQAQLNNYDGAVATFTGTPTFHLAVDTNGNIIQVTGGSGIPISSLLPAIATNDIDNLDFNQIWRWNTIQDGAGLTLSSNSNRSFPTPYLDPQTLLDVVVSGDISVGSPFSSAGRFVNTSNDIDVGISPIVGVYGKATGSGGLHYGVYGTSDYISVFGEGGPIAIAGITDEAGGQGALFRGATGVLIDNANYPGTPTMTLNMSITDALFCGVYSSVGTTTLHGSVLDHFILYRAASANNTAAAGIGQSFKFSCSTNSGFVGVHTEVVANEFISKLTVATASAERSQFIIRGVNAGTKEDQLTIDYDGSITGNGYGSGGITGGAAAFGLAVDNTGKFIEVALGGGGGGTVNSVAGTLNRITSTGGTDPIIDISASYVGQASITTLGTIGTGTWQGTAIGDTYISSAATWNAKQGGDATLTALAGLTITAGSLIVGTGADAFTVLAAGTNGQVLTMTAGTPMWVTTTGTGTVTSIDVAGGTTGLSFSGGPITTNGTITMAGTLIPANGGTGLTTYVIGDILYASSTTALSRLADIATGNVLISGGVGVAPSWGKVALTTHVSGDLPLANLAQGAGLSVLGVAGNATADYANITASADGGILRRNGIAIGFGSINLASSVAVGASILQTPNGGTGQSTYTNGQLLIGNTTGGTLGKATLTQGNAITITNGAASITIAYTYLHTPQNLTDASTTNFDPSISENAKWLIGNINRTLVIVGGGVPGRTYNLEITQGTGGNKTVSVWPVGTTWDGGVPPVLPTAAGATSMVSFYCSAVNVFRAVASNGAFT